MFHGNARVILNSINTSSRILGVPFRVSVDCYWLHRPQQFFNYAKQKAAIKKKEYPVAWYLPDIDAEPSKFTDYLNLLVFELAKCDRRIQMVQMPRYNPKYRFEDVDIKKEVDKVVKSLVGSVKGQYAHHMPIINTLVTAIDQQYQHNKAHDPDQTNFTSTLKAHDLFTNAIQEQEKNVQKNSDDVERKFLSFIYYLRGRLHLESRLDNVQAECDFHHSIDLSKDESPNTPFRSWHGLVGLGRLLHQELLTAKELFQKDVFIDYPQNEQEAYERIKRKAQRIVLLQKKDQENIGRQEFEKQVEQLLSSEMFKAKLEALPRIFGSGVTSYQGAGQIVETVTGETMHKPYPPHEIETKETIDQVIRLFNEAIQLNENFTDAMLERGWFYLNMGKAIYPSDYLDRALADLNRAIEFEERLTKQSPLPYFVRTLILTEKKDYNNALQDINKAITLCPRLELFYKYRALCHFKLKKYKAHYNDLGKVYEMQLKYASDTVREGIINRRLKLAKEAAAKGKSLTMKSETEQQPLEEKKKKIKIVTKLVKRKKIVE